ncbi:hypothetical protein ACFSYD_04660 [Paracoccus aerius]
MSDYNTTNTRLIIPGLQGLYAAVAPLTVLYMRVICGAAFMVHGFPKIMNPMGAVGMVEDWASRPAGCGRRFWRGPSSLAACFWSWAF